MSGSIEKLVEFGWRRLIRFQCLFQGMILSFFEFRMCASHRQNCCPQSAILMKTKKKKINVVSSLHVHFVRQNPIEKTLYDFFAFYTNLTNARYNYSTDALKQGPHIV